MSWGRHEVKEETNIIHERTYTHSWLTETDGHAYIEKRWEEKEWQRGKKRHKRDTVIHIWTQIQADRRDRQEDGQTGWAEEPSVALFVCLSSAALLNLFRPSALDDDPKHFRANSGVRFACSMPRRRWLIRNTRFKRAATLAVIKLAVFGDVAIREISCSMGNCAGLKP